jgi:hypothetical protein
MFRSTLRTFPMHSKKSYTFISYRCVVPKANEFELPEKRGAGLGAKAKAHPKYG